jgi:hypothetical protein
MLFGQFCDKQLEKADLIKTKRVDLFWTLRILSSNPLSPPTKTWESLLGLRPGLGLGGMTHSLEARERSI